MPACGSDPAPTPAVGDPARLRQLVTILLDNAIRHSPRETTVTLAVRPQPGAATLAVDDAGPGGVEDRDRVFDRFGARRARTRLGLAIARWIAEDHDGTISVHTSRRAARSLRGRLPPGHPTRTSSGGILVTLSRSRLKPVAIGLVVLGGIAAAAASAPCSCAARPRRRLGSAAPARVPPAGTAALLPSGAVSTVGAGSTAPGRSIPRSARSRTSRRRSSATRQRDVHRPAHEHRGRPNAERQRLAGARRDGDHLGRRHGGHDDARERRRPSRWAAPATGDPDRAVPDRHVQAHEPDRPRRVAAGWRDRVRNRDGRADPARRREGGRGADRCTSPAAW